MAGLGTRAAIDVILRQNKVDPSEISVGQRAVIALIGTAVGREVARDIMDNANAKKQKEVNDSTGPINDNYEGLNFKFGKSSYQNDDGTLTNDGKKRYGNELAKAYNKDPRKNFALQSDDFRNKATEIADSCISLEDKKTLKDKRSKWLDYTKKSNIIDFENSKEYEELQRDAFNETLKYFKTHEPDYYNSLRANFGNDATSFLDDRRFRKIEESTADSMSSKYEKAFYKNNPENKKKMQEEERLYRDYEKARTNCINNVFGEYGDNKIGDRSLNSIFGWNVDMDKILDNV